MAARASSTPDRAPTATFRSVLLAGRRPSIRPYGFTVSDATLPGVWFRTCTWFSPGAATSAAAVIRHAGADQRHVQADRYVVLDGTPARDVTDELRDRGWEMYPSVTMTVTADTYRASPVDNGVRRRIRRVEGGNAAVARVAWEIPGSVSDARLTRLTRNDIWFTYGPGAGSARLRVTCSDGVAWIDELVVDDDCQGDGIGSALLDTAVGWAFRHGAAQVELAADTFRWPRRWYSGRGFNVTGRFTLAVRWA